MLENSLNNFCEIRDYYFHSIDIFAIIFVITNICKEIPSQNIPVYNNRVAFLQNNFEIPKLWECLLPLGYVSMIGCL